MAANFLSGLGRSIQDAGRTFLAVREAERDRKRQEMLDRRQQELIDLQLAETALSGIEPGAELDARTAALVEKTPLASRLDRSLKARPLTMSPEGNLVRGAETGGVTLRPTFEQRAAMEDRDRMKRQLSSREALAQEYLKSNDPVLRSFGQALVAGLNEGPPLSFEEQKRRTRELGQIEHDFALKRLNATQGTAKQRMFQEVFTRAFEAAMRQDMTPEEAAKAAEQAALLYIGEGIAEPEPEPESAPKADALGILKGPSFMDRTKKFLGSVGSAVRSIPTTQEQLSGIGALLDDFLGHPAFNPRYANEPWYRNPAEYDRRFGKPRMGGLLR